MMDYYRPQSNDTNDEIVNESFEYFMDHWIMLEIVWHPMEKKPKFVVNPVISLKSALSC